MDDDLRRSDPKGHTMKKTVIAAMLVAAGALASSASAHVTVHPNALPSGAFTVVTVNVPNERPKAATTKVDVKLPGGIYFLSYQPLPGWKVKVTYRKLAKPARVFGETITREVDRVVWSGGRIASGQFVAFPLSIRVPERTKGTLLAFKAVQTYSNGEVVRWIGAPSADAPAPQVAVIGATSPVGDVPAGASHARKLQNVLAGVAFGVPLGALLLGGALRRRRES
jgi:uncharacterized protein YcnI